MPAIRRSPRRRGLLAPRSAGAGSGRADGMSESDFDVDFFNDLSDFVKAGGSLLREGHCCLGPRSLP